MGETAINRFINSRVLTWLTAVVGIVAAYAMLLFFGTPSVPPVEGLFGGGLDHLLPSGILSWAVNMVVVFVAAVMLNWLNKTYVFIREHTMMFVTVFLCATLSNPVVSTSLGTPTLLALALVVCTYVMFGTFQQRDSQSVAFLITMILTVCAMQSFVFALYIPVFIVGFFQMRIFTLRTLLAVLVGIVVPVWTATAFGWIDPAQVRLPDLLGGIATLRGGVDAGLLLQPMFMVAVGTILGLSNALTLISYRQQLRVYNGFVNVMAVATVLFMVADVSHAEAYAVVTNMLAAVQVAHFFTIRKMPKLYIVFFALMAVCVALSPAVIYNLLNLLQLI